jgi:hypothetical protein
VSPEAVQTVFRIAGKPFSFLLFAFARACSTAKLMHIDANSIFVPCIFYETASRTQRTVFPVFSCFHYGTLSCRTFCFSVRLVL